MADNPFAKYAQPEQSSAPAPSAGGGNPFAKYAQPAPEKPSVAEDIGNTIGPGLYRGAMGVAGLPADAMNMVDSTWQWGVSKVLEKTGALTPEQAERARQPFQSTLATLFNTCHHSPGMTKNDEISAYMIKGIIRLR
jgi:hypothetical protein